MNVVYLLLLVLLSSSADDLRRVYRRETPATPPVSVNSGSPLVGKESYYPVTGPGTEPRSEPIRELLLPVWPNISPPSVPGVTVRTVCVGKNMQLQVDRSIIGPDEPDSLLRLGTCQPSKSTKNHLYFDYDLGMCGTKHAVIDNQLIYFNMLHYDPPRPRGPVRRALPFSLPVACYSNRYLFSYKVGLTPKVQIHKGFNEMKNFILTPRNARWEKLSPSDRYAFWETMYFEAEAPALSRYERLYVHTCYVSAGESHTATPQFAVMKNFGCAVENKDGRSTFIPNRNDAVRFSVEAAAAAFRGMEGQQLYMHCSMTVGGLTPTPTTKSCNYNKTTKQWVELSGSDSVCDCCDSICSLSAPPVSAAQMVSSEPWTIESKMKSTTSLRRKMGSITTTTAPPPEMVGWRGKWWPEKTAETLVGKTVREMAWPFGGGGVSLVEEEREEKQVKGSAFVEAEKESFTEPRRIFEDTFVFDK